MAEVNLLDTYPRSTCSKFDQSKLDTEGNRRVARQFGREYFDGDPCCGYGGYYYHPRFWQATAKRFRDYYKLADDASVLDVGCAKGFLLHDLMELMPRLTVAGVDLSEYAVEHGDEIARPFLRVGDAKELPFDEKSFDLVISINTIHNLPLADCKLALREIGRVSRRHSFVVVNAWRTAAERDRLMKWDLATRTYMSVEDWKTLFDNVGYIGDYYWFIQG